MCDLIRITRKLFVFFLLLLTGSKFEAQTQAAMNSILFRTMMVQNSKKERGTIFSIDVDNREYWITAKHGITGAPKISPEKKVTLGLLHSASENVEFTDTTFQVIDPGPGIDVVALVTDKPLINA